jgi:hypothetical protein
LQIPGITICLWIILFALSRGFRSNFKYFNLIFIFNDFFLAP